MTRYGGSAIAVTPGRDTWQFECGEGVPGWVVQTCEPYLCNAVETDMQVLPEIRKAMGFYDLLNVPILGRDGRLLGCVEVHNTRSKHGFNERDVQALQTLAELGAGALENAMLLADRQATEEGKRSTKRPRQKL